MRRAKVAFQGTLAGELEEEERGSRYRFTYATGYGGPPISLTMPLRAEPYEFLEFPPFFDGLLPEGTQLEALLRKRKLDRDDPFGQLVAVGADTVGAVTIAEAG